MLFRSETGAPVGGLLEEARGAVASASEGMSIAGAVWVGASKLDSSALALFTDLEVTTPFLLWALRPLASIRAASTSIPLKKKKGRKRKKKKKQTNQLRVKDRKKKWGGRKKERNRGKKEREGRRVKKEKEKEEGQKKRR